MPLTIASSPITPLSRKRPVPFFPQTYHRWRAGLVCALENGFQDVLRISGRARLKPRSFTEWVPFTLCLHTPEQRKGPRFHPAFSRHSATAGFSASKLEAVDALASTVYGELREGRNGLAGPSHRGKVGETEKFFIAPPWEVFFDIDLLQEGQASSSACSVSGGKELTRSPIFPTVFSAGNPRRPIDHGAFEDSFFRDRGRAGGWLRKPFWDPLGE
ncbi:hypothetical protein GWK47_007997 [Chionoecetes opilio]|uniref:Uncharacterized protein n=1 Tax=Chionoecetes opilio TaxID=41210 RepID=A0A8J4XYN0_CHIOP|nr:hypothetical protein GWK47_007997 [Chionoecetes opilio]